MSRSAQQSRITASTPVAELPQLLSVREAAVFFRRSPRTIALWRERGLIRMVRVAGGIPQVPRSEVERLLGEAEGTE